MKTTQLGKTDLNVSKLALGGLFISDYGTDFENAQQAVYHAIDSGINFIDTSPSYGNSEEILGKILPNIRSLFYLSTKFSGDPIPFKPLEKDCLYRAVERSLKRLRVDSIDIMFVHEPDRPGQYDWWETPSDLNHPEAYYGPVLEVLDELKKDGTIKYTGLGSTTAYEIVPIIKSGYFDVLLTAFNYTALWQEAAIEAIPAAKKMGMGVILGSPLQQGALSQRYDQLIARKPAWLSSPRRHQYLELYKLCDELHMNIADLSMRFVFSNKDIDCILTGSKNKKEIDLNIASLEKGPLSDKVVKRIQEIYQMVPFRPYLEPFGLPFTKPYKGPGEA